MEMNLGPAEVLGEMKEWFAVCCVSSGRPGPSLMSLMLVCQPNYRSKAEQTVHKVIRWSPAGGRGNICQPAPGLCSRFPHFTQQVLEGTECGQQGERVCGQSSVKHVWEMWS